MLNKIINFIQRIIVIVTILILLTTKFRVYIFLISFCLTK